MTEPLKKDLLDFAHVLELELCEIELRRSRIPNVDVGVSDPDPTSTAVTPPGGRVNQDGTTPAQPVAANPLAPSPSTVNPGEFDEQQYQAALKHKLVGVAFSGGGIRSATFNLGVLQGLAQLDLLKRIDYLSSVSGGGWIAGWFAAWVQRDRDLENVRRQLCVNRGQQAEAHRQMPPRGNRMGSPPGVTHDVEPPPIKHLRRYSNFLAPRPGVLSTDSWILISQYIRNLFLNQIVILPTVMSVIVLVLLLGMGASALATNWAPDTWAAVAADEVGVLGGICFLVGSVWLACWLLVRLEGVRAETSPAIPPLPNQTTITTVSRQLTFALALLTLTLAGAVMLMLRFSESIHGWIEAGYLPAFIACGAILHSTLNLMSWWKYVKAVIRSLWFLPVSKRTESATAVLSGLAAGASGAGILALTAGLIHKFNIHPLAIATLAVPGLLLGFFLMESLQIGLLGPIQLPRVREWWAMFQARVLLIATCWVVAWGLIIWAPLLLSLGSPYWVGITSTVGWVSTTAAALGISYVPTPKGRPSRLLFLAEIGAGIFLAGLVVCLSYSAFWIFQQDPVLRTRSQENIKQTDRSVTGVENRSVPAAAPVPTNLTGVWTEFSRTLRNTSNVMDNLSRLLQKQDKSAENQAPIVKPDDTVNWSKMLVPEYSRFRTLLLFLLGCLFLMLVAGALIDVNIFSLSELYSMRLVRCYLAASRMPYDDEPGRAPFVVPSVMEESPKPPTPLPGVPTPTPLPPEPDILYRQPNPLTGMAPGDDPHLYRLRPGLGYQGPLHLFNAAVNLARGQELSWQERKADSFVMSPLYCGSATTGYRPIAAECGHGSCPNGPRCDDSKWYANGIRLSRAMGISGAAISSNMGYYSSPAITALLTVFNLRLGQWLGNPHSETNWTSSGPTDGWGYMLKECLGLMRGSHDEPYVYLTDGGHFDNLGVYELIRRRCRVVVAFDAGADGDGEMQELALLMRRVRTDFGIRIDIKTTRLLPVGDLKNSHGHITVGRICYSDRHRARHVRLTPDENDAHLNDWGDGILIYVKPVLSGDETVDIEGYRKLHPEFPHQSTLDQFFSESQFECYRALGFHSVMATLADIFLPESENPLPQLFHLNTFRNETWDLFYSVFKRFRPEPSLTYLEKYSRLNQAYVAIQRQLQTNSNLQHVCDEFSKCARSEHLWRPDLGVAVTPEMVRAERYLLVEIMTMMEDVFFALELVDYRQSTSTGWIKVLERWINTSVFERQWSLIQGEFSPEFIDYVKRFERRLYQKYQAGGTSAEGREPSSTG